MKLAIYGYGNVGRGVECAITKNEDMELFGVFTRRDPASFQTVTGAPVYSADSITDYKDEIDVVVICGGSATDLPIMTPMLAKNFNVVDSFDNHSRIPEHFEAIDAVAREAGTTALISGGWDPGLFSLNRVVAMSVLPGAEAYTFWGRGVSQGHSDAVRRIPGVADCRQYTVPVPEAVERVRAGENPVLTAGEKHTRECFVSVKEGADKEAIEKAIKTMPAYFEPYTTTVEFISDEEMKANHSEMPHGGSVIVSGRSGFNDEHIETIEYKLTLDSNPEFTAGGLVALARATGRMNDRGQTGCKTILDIAAADMSPLSPEELRAHWL